MNVTVTMDAPTPDETSAVLTLAYLLTDDEPDRLSFDDVLKMLEQIHLGIAGYFEACGRAEEQLFEVDRLPALARPLYEIMAEIETAQQELPHE